jgi:hypothetical protein
MRGRRIWLLWRGLWVLLGRGWLVSWLNVFYGDGCRRRARWLKWERCVMWPTANIVSNEIFAVFDVCDQWSWCDVECLMALRGVVLGATFANLAGNYVCPSSRTRVFATLNKKDPQKILLDSMNVGIVTRMFLVSLFVHVFWHTLKIDHILIDHRPRATPAKSPHATMMNVLRRKEWMVATKQREVQSYC